MNWFRNRKELWLKRQEERLQSEYSIRLCNVESQLSSTLRDSELILEKARAKKSDMELDLQYLEDRLTDRRMEFLRAEDSLKEQIKLLEAKARPDSVWVSAYTAGFNRALDMLPEFSAVLRAKIESQAIDNTLKRLNGNGSGLNGH